MPQTEDGIVVFMNVVQPFMWPSKLLYVYLHLVYIINVAIKCVKCRSSNSVNSMSDNVFEVVRYASGTTFSIKESQCPMARPDETSFNL